MPDYGTTLFDTQQHLSGGRKTIKGVLVSPDYNSPRVNIRASKWQDNVFWIKAEDYEAAQWMADAVYYHTGRPPFHFRRSFDYGPPLQLGSGGGELLDTREKCWVHVTKIAKGPAFLSERRDYKERVKKLILEAVRRPDVVQFLDELREERRSPVEVDALSEEALRLLAPADLGHVDAATCMLLRAADTSTFGCDVNLSTAFVPSFGIDEPENVLLSVGQNIGYAYHRKALEFRNLPTSLDKGSQSEGVKSVPRSSDEYVEWLERNGGLVHELLTIPTASREGTETSAARILTALAGELTYLRPGNRSRLGYDINMREWRIYWNELISEMKTVDPHTSSLGVYVLTTWPYPEFLKTLARRLIGQQITS